MPNEIAIRVRGEDDASGVFGKVKGEAKAFINLKGVDPSLEGHVTDLGTAMQKGRLSDLRDATDGELPGIAPGAPTGHIYRHVPDQVESAPEAPEPDGTGDHRRGLNQGRFDVSS